ncbi:MAG TPA: hypothetical protein VHA09_09885 [Nitrososphaera sp.]|nr:hypothetical protein [Nitrososphaera sp.]
MRIIQLWTNSTETEFAIRLASDTIAFRACSSNASDYVKVADEMYELDDQQIDWPFMLEKWIEAWKDGFRHSDLSYGWKQLQEARQNDAWRNGPAPAIAFNGGQQKGGKKSRKKRRKYRRKILTVKCRFCNLMFYNDVERSVHEKEWHANKANAK